jgi:membrane protease YdiL (CAAX protease family)
MLSGIYALLFVIAAAGAVATFLYLQWRSSGQNFLAIPRVRWGRWTGADVVLTIVMMELARMAVAVVLQKIGIQGWIYGVETASDSSRMRMSLWSGLLFLPLFLALAFAGLRSLSGTYPADLGLSPSRWRANLLLGYVGFVLATPVVLLVNTLLSLGHVVKEHPFEDLARTGMSPVEWCLMFFSAMVMAPLIEELLFRGLLLGWLRRASLAGHVTLLTAGLFVSLSFSIEFNKSVTEAKDVEGRQMVPAPEELFNNIEAIHWSRIGVTFGLGLVYVIFLLKCQQKKLFMTEADFLPNESSEGTDLVEAEPHVGSPAPTGWAAQDLKQQREKAWLAIFGSSFAFAMIHSTWPGPVPLLMLGLVLGWLTQRTQNLLPAIVLHSLFNAVATFTLLFQTLSKS